MVSFSRVYYYNVRSAREAEGREDGKNKVVDEEKGKKTFEIP